MISPNGEFVTDIVAGGAVTSHMWLPSLQQTSSVAGELIPILGGLWLLVQITRALILGYVALQAWKAKRKHHHKKPATGELP